VIAYACIHCVEGDHGIAALGAIQINRLNDQSLAPGVALVFVGGD
jgi:hypothetical protein